MIDIRKIRENPEEIIAALAKRTEGGYAEEINDIIMLDTNRRNILTVLNSMKAERNAVSKQIPVYKAEGKDIEPVMASMRALGAEIETRDAELAEIEQRLESILASLPNLPDSDVAPGGKESNQVIEIFGEMPEFGFTVKNHVDLCEGLGIIDYKRGAKLGGNGSWIYRGDGARLEWALLNFFVSEHLTGGYEFILPPHMLSWECGYVAGQFPKFAEEVFHIANPSGDEKRFMLPTAETALVNMYRDEIIKAEDLPMKYMAYTPCYRREAGSYRSEERGMIRGHQFNKVEMFQLTTAEQSDEAFSDMLKRADLLVQKLGLHHRISKLAAGDVSASMARTCDIEVWLPSIGIFKEVSSVSNAREYQARRGNIRYRSGSGELAYVHTLNGSGLATSRIFPAIIEQYQNEDGTVRIPEVLVPFMGGQKILS